MGIVFRRSKPFSNFFYMDTAAASASAGPTRSLHLKILAQPLSYMGSVSLFRLGIICPDRNRSHLVAGPPIHRARKGIGLRPAGTAARSHSRPPAAGSGTSLSIMTRASVITAAACLQQSLRTAARQVGLPVIRS